MTTSRCRRGVDGGALAWLAAATVTGKFYSRAPAPAAGRAVERRLRALFERGPRERLPAPLTESHVYV